MSEKLYAVVDKMPSNGVWGHPFTVNPDTWLVPVEPDYEAAAKAWAEVIPFYLTWDHLDEREKDAHRKWAKIVVDTALRLGVDDE